MAVEEDTQSIAVEGIHSRMVPTSVAVYIRYAAAEELHSPSSCRADTNMAMPLYVVLKHLTCSNTTLKNLSSPGQTPNFCRVENRQLYLKY